MKGSQEVQIRDRDVFFLKKEENGTKAEALMLCSTQL